jgi:hypothetical protein
MRNSKKEIQKIRIAAILQNLLHISLKNYLNTKISYIFSSR